MLGGYGTGAIMAVPAHDERDFEFARKFGLPIVEVVMPSDADPDEVLDRGVRRRTRRRRGPGQLRPVHAADRRPTAVATTIVGWLAEQGKGRDAVTYRLRDWLVSRQRYWGTPIPVIHCER